MKLFYAMQFTGKGYDDIVKERQNIAKRASAVGVELLEQFIGRETKEEFERHGYGPLQIAKKDHDLLREADIVFADYTGHSIGRDCEIVLGKETFDKRIISIVPDEHARAHPWIRLYSDYIVSDLDEAFALLKKLAEYPLAGRMDALSREQKDAIDVKVNEAVKKAKGKADAVSGLLPTELVSRWKGIFGDEYDDVLAHSFRPLRKTLRVNTLSATPKDMDAIAQAHGWKIEPHPAADFLFRMTDTAVKDFRDIREFNEGKFYVQDLASTLPPLALDPQPGERILEIGAAPGSKSTQLSQMMDGKGVVVANDISAERMKSLEKSAERLGIRNIESLVCDGREIGEKFPESFDRVLVDVPCTCEGIIRYKPHKFFEWHILMMYRLVELQSQMIESAFKALKKGGTLIYSTCTYAPEENEQIVDGLLRHHTDADIEPVSWKGISSRPGLTNWSYLDYDERLAKTVRIYPQDNDTIGFYVAKILKK